MDKAREKAGAQRIVSLAPNVTSILLALGAERELVGVSKWCKEVARVGNRPQVGDCWKLEVNEVMRLKPTLLIGSVPFSKEVVGRILEQPVAFLAINPRSLADIENENIAQQGRLVGRSRLPAGKASPENAARIQKCPAGASVSDTFMQGNRASIAKAWPKPRDQFLRRGGQMVEIVGGCLVVPAGARVSDEEVARAKPDVIVLAWTATGDRARPEQTLRNPLWRNISAVANKRVVVIRDELLNTPGPPLVDGIRELAQAIHPGGRREHGKWPEIKSKQEY